MTEQFATTPFGGGRISVSEFRRRAGVAERRAQVNAGGGHGRNDDGRADKYSVIRALSEARAAFDLSDRTIAVLEALLSFHQARDLDGSAPIVVFPSNGELSLRTRGMAEATLRRHLAALVEAGLILRRDSPNGKRYALRGDTGEVESAFGFDVSPLALAAPKIHEAAERARAEQRASQRLRGEITIHLRDAAKIIEAAISEKRAGDWTGFSLALVPLARRLSRQAPLNLLEARLADVAAFRAKVETAYLDCLSEQEMSVNDVDSGRHYQNSNTDPHFESSSEKELKRGVQNSAAAEAEAGWGDQQDEPWQAGGADDAGLTADNRFSHLPEADRARAFGGAGAFRRGTGEGGGKAGPRGDTGSGMTEKTLRRAPETKGEPVPLTYLLAVCPTLSAYAKAGIGSWRDVVSTAALIRSMLGISADAWAKARAAMGEAGAAAAVAAMLERAETIRSPGGYLRALTDRAEAGKFSVRPMLAALEKDQGM